jgi:hypothetical protein
MKMLSNEEIDAWLKSHGRDREWLADQIPASIGTVYNWFSKGFSKSAMKTIALLMERDQGASADTGLIQFTVDEFERIERARQQAGYETRPPFYRDAILKQVDALEKEMPTLRLPKPITYLPAGGSKPDADLRIADEPSKS